mgnify:CR=1 FL=1
MKPGTIRVVIGPRIHTHGKCAEEINRSAEAWVEGKMGNWRSSGRQEPDAALQA